MIRLGPGRSGRRFPLSPPETFFLSSHDQRFFLKLSCDRQEVDDTKLQQFSVPVRSIATF